MNALTTAGAVFATIAGSGLAGLMLGRRLPPHHLDADSRDVVRLVAGFLATLAALVLGLLIASAKSNFDERSGQLHRIAGDVVALDRTLARYGEGAAETRAILRSALTDEVDRLSSGGRVRGDAIAQPVGDARLLGFAERLQALAPQTDGQRSARDRAAQLAEGIATTRVLMTQDLGGSIPTPFLIVVTFWLAALFGSFGLFARANATVTAALLVGSLSVAGAVFLILELDRPLDGFMRLSVEPLRQAIGMVGR